MSALAEHTRSEFTPFDPLPPDLIANPYSFYVTCRESDPVRRGTPPEPFRPFFEMTGDRLIFRDPPGHTRLRKLAGAALTRERVGRTEPRIRGVAQELSDRAGAGFAGTEGP